METYFFTQRKEANSQAYKYFQKLIGKPIITNLRELNLMTKIYAYHYHMRESPHDVDVTAELTGELMEALFWTLEETSVPLLLRGGDLIVTPDKTPPLDLDSLFSAGRKILELIKVKTPREKLNTLGDLLDEVRKLIESLLILSKFEDFKGFVELYCEMKKFWPQLKAQRDEAIKRKPHLHMELESTSIFPLLYKPNEGNHTLVKLLNQYAIKFLPSDLYNMRSFRLKIEELVNLLIIYYDKTFKQAEEIIESNSGCKPGDILLGNFFTLNTAVLNSVTPPSFKECWLRVNYIRPAVRNLLYDLDNLEDFCDLGAATAIARAHHEVINIKKEEELEIIVPDNTNELASTSQPDEEGKIDEARSFEPYLAQGGHNLPILRHILTQTPSRVEAAKKPLKILRWAIPLQIQYQLTEPTEITDITGSASSNNTSPAPALMTAGTLAETSSSASSSTTTTTSTTPSGTTPSTNIHQSPGL